MGSIVTNVQTLKNQKWLWTSVTPEPLEQLRIWKSQHALQIFNPQLLCCSLNHSLTLSIFLLAGLKLMMPFVWSRKKNGSKTYLSAENKSKNYMSLANQTYFLCEVLQHKERYFSGLWYFSSFHWYKLWSHYNASGERTGACILCHVELTPSATIYLNNFLHVINHSK